MKREIIYTIKDIGPEGRDAVTAMMVSNGILYDGIMIECNERKAYIWRENYLKNQAA